MDDEVHYNVEVHFKELHNCLPSRDSENKFFETELIECLN